MVPRWPQGSADRGVEPGEGSRTPSRLRAAPSPSELACPLSRCRSVPLRGQRQFAWRPEPPLPLAGPWCWALLDLGMGLASPSLPR